MLSIRGPVILVLVATLGACPACSSGGTTAASACADVCHKQEACGDIDSVVATQCTTKCSANAQVLEAAASKCLNASDILAATEQCLSRLCPDYQSCLTTLPACLTNGGAGGAGAGGAGAGGAGAGGAGTGGAGTGGAGTGGGTVGTGAGCFGTTAGLTYCAVLPSTAMDTCPAGSTQVSSCPTANLLGQCTSSGGITYMYSNGGVTADSAKHGCTSLLNGTWTPA